MGWCQTAKSSFWKHGSFDEFVGLKEGYWCVIRDSRAMITLEIYYQSGDEGRLKEIKTELSRQRRLLGFHGLSIINGRITLLFFGWGLLFQSKTEKLKRALEAMPKLLISCGVEPSAVCGCGSKDQLKCYKGSDTKVRVLCAECATKADSLF